MRHTLWPLQKKLLPVKTDKNRFTIIIEHGMSRTFRVFLWVTCFTIHKQCATFQLSRI